MITAAPTTWIEKSPGRMGGEACIRRTRFAVWLLVEARNLGMSDDEQLKQYEYSGLTREDLAAAWEYARENPEEIQAAITRNNQDAP
jgi:uncharacterized protein (DUF433 family)